jgi:RNA polymerase sigma-70 factor (ECF subfamily)
MMKCDETGPEGSNKSTGMRSLDEQHPHLVTELLGRAASGDSGAARELLPLVYERLRKLARRHMQSEPPNHTLDPTALVHEAYLRLTGGEPLEWKSQAHFFGAAARAMRRILVERARRYRRVKHGGALNRVALGELPVSAEGPAEDLLALDEALERLEVLDARKHDVVLLRYFAGLGVEEVARVLQVSPETVKRDWSFARAWLHSEIEGDGGR